MRERDDTPGLLDDVTYRRLCRSRDFLAAHCHRRLKLEDAAREGCLSPWHFHRLYALAFGETPHEFFTRRRIAEAKRRMVTGSESVTEICFEIGYESLGTFSARFRNLVGRSPREYRRSMRRTFNVPFAWHMAFIPSCFVEFFGVDKESQDRRRNPAGTLAS